MAIHAAEAAIKEARQAAKRGRAVHRVGAKRKMAPEFSEQRERESACAVEFAKFDRDKAVASVQDVINKLVSDNQMIVLWRDGVWLQAQRFDLPLSQFDDVTDSIGMHHLHAALKRLQTCQ
jgi:thioesterase domain-containing protein